MTSLKTSIKTITYLSDIGCLEIQGASLPLINILCIEEYYSATGIYNYDDADEQTELLKNALRDYKMAH